MSESQWMRESQSALAWINAWLLVFNFFRACGGFFVELVLLGFMQCLAFLSFVRRVATGVNYPFSHLYVLSHIVLYSMMSCNRISYTWKNSILSRVYFATHPLSFTSVYFIILMSRTLDIILYSCLISTLSVVPGNDHKSATHNV